MQASALIALLIIQLAANTVGEATEAGPSPQAPAIQVGDLEEAAGPSHCTHLESEPRNGRSQYPLCN